MHCNALVAIIICLPAGGPNENHHVCRLHVKQFCCFFLLSLPLYSILFCFCLLPKWQRDAMHIESEFFLFVERIMCM